MIGGGQDEDEEWVHVSFGIDTWHYKGQMEADYFMGAQQGRQFSFSSKKVHPGNQPENAGAASERASGMGNDRKNDKWQLSIEIELLSHETREKDFWSRINYAGCWDRDDDWGSQGRIFKRKRAVIVTKK